MNAVLLPDNWLGLNQKDFEKMVNNLDDNWAGKIDSRIQLSYLYLGSSEKPAFETLQGYSDELMAKSKNSGKVTMDDFLDVSLYFLITNFRL